MQTQTLHFQAPASEAPTYLVPDAATLFQDRARRFAELATDHPLEGWLQFLGQLTQAQHEALTTLSSLPLPDAAQLERAKTHCMPPLHASTQERPVIWQTTLQHIAQTLLKKDIPAPAQTSLSTLLKAEPDTLEQLAETLLTGTPDPETLPLLPFVAAALQTVFTVMAQQLGTASLQALDTHGLCPCCGSLPVSSVVRLGSAVNNLRYLHCTLCNTEWNMPRAVCSSCNTDKDLALQELQETKDTPGTEPSSTQGTQDASSQGSRTRAETCDHCKSYLKIFYQEKDPHVDPVADDLASLSLDILVDEAGYERSGPNLFMLGANT